jgi:small multidrug resistance family-3 protein
MMDDSYGGMKDTKKSAGKIVALLILAGLFEIGGGYVIWLWLKEDLHWIVGILGGLVLFVYGLTQTMHQFKFHRLYAAYGVVFIILAMLWGLIIDKTILDMFDITGAVIALTGASIILFWPRKVSSNA